MDALAEIKAEDCGEKYAKTFTKAFVKALSDSFAEGYAVGRASLVEVDEDIKKGEVIEKIHQIQIKRQMWFSSWESLCEKSLDELQGILSELQAKHQPRPARP
jgi:hypothetical protein